MDLFFQLLKVDGVERAQTDKPKPFKTLTDEAVTDFGLAGAFELHNMSGLRRCRYDATEILCELRFRIDEFRREDFRNLFLSTRSGHSRRNV